MFLHDLPDRGDNENVFPHISKEGSRWAHSRLQGRGGEQTIVSSAPTATAQRTDKSQPHDEKSLTRLRNSVPHLIPPATIWLFILQSEK